MFKVTKAEETAVSGLEGIYHSLRTSAEKVARILFYDFPIATATPSNSTKGARGFFKGFFKKKPKDKVTVTKEDLMVLLEVLNLLQHEFETNMPLIVNGNLYFKFRCFDGREHDSHTYKIGEAKDRDDLIACFQAMEERIVRILATPEVAQVVKNTCLHPYCSLLAKEILGISSLHGTYLKSHKNEE